MAINIIGLCHLCKTQTEISYCKLCGHWFCKDCYKKYGGRAIAFFKNIINSKQVCCGPDTIVSKQDTETKGMVAMAKSKEQYIQESLGMLTFQVLIIQAELEAEREKNQALVAELAKLKEEKKNE